MASWITAKGKGVKINNAALRELVGNPNGPVVRRCMVVAESVKVATTASLKPGFPRDFLGPSIVKRLETTSKGPRVLVGSARIQTSPHLIEGNPTLVFDWPKAGGVVYFRNVNHPGSNFGKYLTERLLAALAAVRGAV